MPSVTQRVNNYLGGVSRQSDDKKLPGQVEECLNGYPDPTFGLTKRPGLQAISILGTGTTYDNSKWFYISRTETEKYIGCITPSIFTITGNGGSNATNKTNLATTTNGSGTGLTVDLTASGGVVTGITVHTAGQSYATGNTVTIASSAAGTGSNVVATLTLGSIHIWNATTGVKIPNSSFTYGTDAQGYLLGAREDFDILTVQDTSIITNKRAVVSTMAAPSFTAKSQATIKLINDCTSTPYKINVNNTGDIDHTSGATDKYEDILTELKNAITAKSISGLTITQTADSLHLSRTSAFTITGTGGKIGNKLTIFQDQATSLAQLPNESKHGHVVKILSSGAVGTSYFMKYTADNGTSGAGFWSETVSPSVSLGLMNSRMPHELQNTNLDTFEFKQLNYVDRAVGDDETNKHPSFVSSKIKRAFFHNNRLGFISGDTVSLSQAGEFFDFYHTSAQTVTDADPIDVSASAIRPAALHSVIPTTQGLVLFSANQQFLMSANDGILTPATAGIRAISNYEMDTVIEPVDTGTTLNFISKTPSYTRVFSMVTRGENENPQVLDIGRVVNEWIPSTVDTFISSPQNQFIALSGQNSRYIYFFRTYSDGERNLVQAWFNWQAPGNVQTIVADSDEFYAVTKQANQFVLCKASLSQSPEDAIIVNNDGQKINPCIDLYTTASSVEYDSTNNFSKCFIPYADATDLTPVLIIKGNTATGNFIESGFTITPERVVESSGAKSGQTYFKVPGKDLSSLATDVIVGYKYDFDVILPKTYFKMDDGGTQSDFTANLTVARMKFAVGLSGIMGFKLKSKGVRQGERSYTADGTTKEFEWDPTDIDYIDDDQIKVKINNIVTSAYTVNTLASPLPKITLTNASSELKRLTGDGSTKVFDLGFTPVNISKMQVKIGGANWSTTTPIGDATLQTVTDDYVINGRFIHFTTAPAAAAENILVYSADDILVYLDEWYNVNPVITADMYLGNDIPISDHSVFTLPIHQKTDNFTLRLFNDTAFPVALNSMMWEGTYSPRFYRRT